jgi:hypothetical protein
VSGRSRRRGGGGCFGPVVIVGGGSERGHGGEGIGVEEVGGRRGGVVRSRGGCDGGGRRRGGCQSGNRRLELEARLEASRNEDGILLCTLVVYRDSHLEMLALRIQSTPAQRLLLPLDPDLARPQRALDQSLMRTRPARQLPDRSWKRRRRRWTR